MFRIPFDVDLTLVPRLKAMGARILDPEPRTREDRYKAVTVMDNMGNKVNLINKTTTALGRVFSMDVGI
jgi:hypothetical protein